MKENERKKRVRWKKSLKKRHDWQEKIGDGEKKKKYGEMREMLGIEKEGWKKWTGRKKEKEKGD